MSIIAELSDGIMTLTINRPQVRNAVNPEVWLALGEHLDRARSDDAVRVVIITGAGEKAFVAGADIAYMRERTVADVLGGLGQEVYDKIERLPKPVIAAVNGYALGGGCELALACDIRIAATTAAFGQPEVNFGIIPGAGGTQRLVRVLGLGRAKHLLLTGEIIDAAEALHIGLVSRLSEPADLLADAHALAQRLITKGPLALGLIKAAALAATDADQRTGLMLERLAQAVAFSSADAREGLAAFLEKRAPRFQGR
ncbi:MAG TPA: enoyl-CoA hydratase-related protein [Symbiobacteriaceae bacterium]|nr:enoyl-CoA hydratase-related protein [Symbiobacteriaceae bacterium]